MSKVSIIGSGISGLSAACFLAKEGHTVSIYEKNATIGGRARQYTDQGFTYDMGPSWYWMPDVFDNFFKQFGKTTSDYYDLVKLDPGFRMFFGRDDSLDIPANIKDIYSVFEQIEEGSAGKLKKYLADAEYKYREGMLRLAYKPSLSWREFMQPSLIGDAIKLNLFTSISKHIRSYFKNERLIALMEFPVLFLGAMPWQIPAMYSMMNYTALAQGTWYPMGGMYKVIEAMRSLATSLGANIVTSTTVENITIKNSNARELHTTNGTHLTDAVIGACDYHHLEKTMLEKRYQNYAEAYWDKKILAPSCLIFYIGVNKKIGGLIHHNLFFDADLTNHARDIYEDPQWPQQPLFYVCCPSKTDTSVAPPGHENLFLLMPVAPGLSDDHSLQEHYFNKLITRMETICRTDIANHIIYRRSYSVSDFTNDYNAYKGNAYGLANTLNQTAIFKPAARNKKVRNLFYAGQLTVPGPGVPPAFISGQIAAELAIKHFRSL